MSNDASDARTPTADTGEALRGRWVCPLLILALTALLTWWVGRAAGGGAGFD